MPAAAAQGHPTAGLRLALVYDCLYPQTIGGIEHRNAQLAAALAARGHRVTLAGFGAAAAAAPGVEVLSLGPRPTGLAPRRSAATLRFARAMLGLPLARFDVVETANIPFAHLLPLAARCRLARVPLLVTWHEVWGRGWRRVAAGPAWRALAALEWLGAQQGDAVTAVSALTATRLQRYRGGDRVAVIPNGLPAGEVAAAARAGAQAPAAPLVSAGRLLPHKRLDLLLEAAARLAPAVPGPLLTLIGDGPERGALEAQATRLGLTGRVRFAGHVPSAERVWQMLGAARVAVQPSAREGFGIFPLEAMAAGLPVVYCPGDDSAVSELVRDGVEGVAVPPDPRRLAETLQALLADGPRRERLAAAGRRRALEYDWNGVASRFEALVRRLAEAP